MIANLRTLAYHGRTVRGVSETVGLTPLLHTWQPLVERGRQTHLLPAIRISNKSLQMNMDIGWVDNFQIWLPYICLDGTVKWLTWWQVARRGLVTGSLGSKAGTGYLVGQWKLAEVLPCSSLSWRQHSCGKSRDGHIRGLLYHCCITPTCFLGGRSMISEILLGRCHLPNWEIQLLIPREHRRYCRLLEKICYYLHIPHNYRMSIFIICISLSLSLSVFVWPVNV
jgi:hypothetical protein